MHMYHSWGSQNAWLRQITSQNRLFIHRETAARLGLADDDWAWIESPHGRVKGQVRLVDGVNPQTVWTWNAIGKRRGAWMLKDDAPEAEKGFLLNHAISEFLPADTERPAPFELRSGDRSGGMVRSARAGHEMRRQTKSGSTEPQFPPLPDPAGHCAGARRCRGLARNSAAGARQRR